MAQVRSSRTGYGRVLDLVTLREVADHCLWTRQQAIAVIRVEPIKLFALLPDKKQEELLAGFKVLLSRLAVGEDLSIHVRVRPWDLSAYLDHLAAQANETELEALADDHRQFLSELTRTQSLLRQEFFVRCAVPLPRRVHRRPTDLLQTREQLDRAVQALIRDLHRCGVVATRLSTEELIEYYYSCLHAHAAQVPLPDSVLAAVDRAIQGHWQTPPPVSTTLTLYEEPISATEPLTINGTGPASEPSIPKERRWLWRSTRSLEKQQRRHEQRAHRKPETPPLPLMQSLPELLQPTLVEVQREYLTIRAETDEYLRARALIGYPAELVAGWFDRLLHPDEPFVDLVLHLETLRPASVVRRLSQTITRLRGTQLVESKQGRTENPYVQAKREEVESLRDALVRQEERVHGVSLYLFIRADTRRTLKARDERLKSLLTGLELVSAELTYEHLQAWQTLLPEGRDVLKRRRVLDTSSLVTAFPFTSPSLSMEAGICVGVTPSNGLVLVDPGSPLLENGHELIIARSGAGKSYYQKLWAARALMLGAEVIVLDPEQEYRALCHQVGGTTVHLAPGAFSLNPFDLPIVPPESEERRVFAEKLENLLVLFDLLLAEKTPGVLSQKEKGYLNKILLRVYAEQGITQEPETHHRVPPAMRHVHEAIIADGDPCVLADRLARHLSAFPEQTLVDLDAPLVVFSIRDLSDALKPVGLFLVTDFVWNRVRQESAPRPRFLMIDEAWVLMQFLEGGRFLADLSRRARKYHLHLKMVTQDVEDFLSSEAGRTIVQNCAMKMLMKQDTSAIDLVTQAFQLSEEERRYLVSCGKGEGLFFLGESHTPLTVLASAQEHQFATTDPLERWHTVIQQQEQEVQEGVTEIQL